MSEYCRECKGVNSCPLLQQLKSQSETGGLPTKESNKKSPGTGPYWERENWKGFTTRINSAIDGCPQQIKEEISRTIDSLTKQKEDRGHFID